MKTHTFEEVAVIGAAGKMGRGIAQLLLQDMASQVAQKKEYRLILIDMSEAALVTLRHYLRSQLKRYAEKKINKIREYFASSPNLVSNEEIIQAYVENAMDRLLMGTELTLAKNAQIVFEAIFENIEAKTNALTTLRKNAKQKQYYFTNTSSIPISLLDESSQLEHRIIGFHFYNPPQVQKLVEIIIPDKIDPILPEIAEQLAKRLEKVVVYAHDTAGFIGNGHFIREMLFACKQARELSQELKISITKAIYLINEITQEYLIRPMGIFQLVDYVGIDVCKQIAQVMNTHLPDPSLHDSLIDQMATQGHTGGQNVDGTQKQGFFQYKGLTPTGIFSPEHKKYVPTQGWNEEARHLLGPLPNGHVSWKHLQNDPQRDEKLQEYFKNLFASDELGAQYAQRFLQESQKIALDLVKTKVVDKIEDVDQVLQNGFFHLYGPKTCVT